MPIVSIVQQRIFLERDYILLSTSGIVFLFGGTLVEHAFSGKLGDGGGGFNQGFFRDVSEDRGTGKRHGSKIS